MVYIEPLSKMTIKANNVAMKNLIKLKIIFLIIIFANILNTYSMSLFQDLDYNFKLKIVPEIIIFLFVKNLHFLTFMLIYN